MPKKKAKKKGAAKRDSGYSEEKGERAYKTGSLFGTEPANQEFYGQNGSVHAGGDPEEPEAPFEKRGVGLDFAILDSTFLLSQVFPTLFMGTVVQLAQSVTAYIAFSAIFGAVAIYLAGRIVFDQKDLKS